MDGIARKYRLIVVILMIVSCLAMFVGNYIQISKVSEFDRKITDSVVENKYKDEMKLSVSKVLRRTYSEELEAIKELSQRADYIKHTVDTAKIPVSKAEILKIIRYANAEQMGTPIKLLCQTDMGETILCDSDPIVERHLTAVELSEVKRSAVFWMAVSLSDTRGTIIVLKSDVDAIVKAKMRDVVAGLAKDKEYICVDRIWEDGSKNKYLQRMINPICPSSEGKYFPTDAKDSEGDRFYKGDLSKIKDVEGMYTQITVPSEGKNEEWMFYSMYYKPYNWVVSTGYPLSKVYSDLGGISENRKKLIGENLVVSIVFGVMVILLGVLLITLTQKKYNRDVASYMRSEKEKLQEKQLVELKKALEGSEDANKAKNEFLFNISHDIRTPINAIIGFATLSEKNIDNREYIKGAVKKIKSSAEVLLSLVNDMLELARIEGRNMELHLIPCNIHDLISTMYSVFEIQMKKKDLHFELKEDIENYGVYCDMQRLNQISINLLSNAMKFTPEGGSVTYSIVQTSRNVGGIASYKIMVEDTGIGMSEEFQKKMFTLFERERTSTVTKNKGTGLGLTIVKAVSDAMDGNIRVKSVQNKGTSIEINFSLKIAEEKEICTGHENTGDEFKGKKILLVEDNEFNREIACEILRDSGFEVYEANDGTVAVDMIKNAKAGDYDLILMDIQMPLMDGYRATEEIRAMKDSPLSGIPVIAMTANAFKRDRDKAIESGMDYFITKPVDIEKFFDTLRKVF